MKIEIISLDSDETLTANAPITAGQRLVVVPAKYGPDPDIAASQISNEGFTVVRCSNTTAQWVLDNAKANAQAASDTQAVRFIESQFEQQGS